jgi:PST family polysaccharide transporter
VNDECLVLKRKVYNYFDENKAHAGLGRESLHSGVAFVAARGLNMVVQVGTTILLARLLSPRDYGLVAMVFALVGFAPMLIDLGTTDATVQRKRITHADVSALFWLKVAIAGTLTLLLVGASGYIASFYGEPALVDIALVSSLTFVVAALSAQHFALMRRAMQFKRMAAIEIASNVISSIIAIAMALTGWGYWALVAKPILGSGLSAVAAWMSCPWLPGRPRFTPEAKEMVGFGMGVTGFTMTDYLAQSADRVALGYFYGAGPLGYYQNAVLLYNNLLSLFTQLHDVAVSSLSKLRSNVEELKRSWAAALSSLTFFSMLAFAGLAVTGQDFVVILLGQKWAPAGPLLCILAVRGIAHVVERTLGWLHVAAGRSDRWMRWGFFSAIFQLIMLFAAIPFGIAAVATAHAIAAFCLFVPALIYAGRPVGIDAKDVLRAVGPQTVAALATVAIGLAAQHLFLDGYSQLTRFAFSVPICVAVYLIICVGVFKVTGPLRLVLSLLRDFSSIGFRRSPQLKQEASS